ncbi:MAG: Transcriptional regulator, MarR family [Clostridiales bacterium 38_11]|nr:MAG: Transcriptional regulator, MarR family [Clostridiales bacterium 38_11]HBH13753.1 MarR family transcriptional regulator [Clostridiales bacterium]
MNYEYEGLKLKNQLCFPLYASSRLIVRLYGPVLEPLGLTYTKYIVMLALWEKDNIGLKELGGILFLDSGTLTPLLKKLEIQGLVTRERNLEDERNINIKLTDRGKRLKETAKDIPAKIGSCINMSARDLKELHRLLHIILENNKESQCLGL